jgi:hypothetical protein
MFNRLSLSPTTYSPKPSVTPTQRSGVGNYLDPKNILARNFITAIQPSTRFMTSSEIEGLLFSAAAQISELSHNPSSLSPTISPGANLSTVFVKAIVELTFRTGKRPPEEVFRAFTDFVEAQNTSGELKPSTIRQGWGS